MLRLISWLACRLSPAGVITLGRSVGWLLWSLVRIRRKVALGNIHAALHLPLEECRQLGRRVYNHLGATAIEFLRLRILTPKRAKEILGVENLARLQKLRESGNGVLILSAHLGNWDLLACSAGLCGLPVKVITRSIKRSWLNRYWMEERRRCGVELLPAQGSALAIRKALRENEIVAFVLDQHQPSGLAVDFFGRPAATATSLARLARATGAPVVPAFLMRDGLQHRLHLLEPMPQAAGESRENAVAEATAAYTHVIETYVRRFPEQWFWVHRRWKI